MENTADTASGSALRRMIFLHQSTGTDIIKDGNLRGLLKQQAPSVEFWDYAYNPPSLRYTVASVVGLRHRMPDHYYGLRNGTGQRVKGSFHLPFDNTSPEGLAGVFAQPPMDPPSNTFSELLGFDVIAFKSCFTILPIASDAQLERYQQAYVAIQRVMDQYPTKLFVPFTPPPLRASLTTADQAARARRFARWIMSEEFHGGRTHIVPFDLFDALAAPESGPDTNTLRPEYCRPDAGDSHPNPKANRVVAAQLAAFLAQTVGQLPGVGQPLTAQ